GSNTPDPFVVVVDPNQTPESQVTFTVALSGYGACGPVQFVETIHAAVVDVLPTPEVLPEFVLAAVEPNPATREARILYAMRNPGRVLVALFDVQGRRVRTIVDGWCTAGRRVAVWDGRDDGGHLQPPGVYLAQGTRGSAVSKLRFVW